MIWVGSAFTADAVVAVGAQSVTEIISPSSPGEDIVAGGTIRRMVGELTVAAAAVSQSDFFRFGIITINEDAGDALVIPDPYADPAAWMFERSGWVRTSNIDERQQMYHIAFDTSVMRKLPQLERSLLAIMENEPGSAGNINYFLSIKCLVHVP